MAVLSGFVVPYIFALLYLIPVALSFDLCSSTNTGSKFDSVLDIFQSDGACTKTCSRKYSVAILQGKFCWCSDNVPGGTIDNNACSEPCPGYPSDKCGNSQEGLYAYILLKKPSQTIGSITKTPMSTQTPTSTSTSGTSSSQSADSIASVTPTEPPGQNDEATSSSSLSGGAIAGIVVGTLLGIGVIVSAILWLFYIRRRREREDSKVGMNGYDHPASSPSFHTSIQSPAMTYQRSPSMNGPMGMHDRNLLGVSGFTDSRMKKDAAIYPNGNRQSNVSLQDNQDYSRPVLRLTNPDP
ncbi:hypothetical protein, variant 3 [Blastomyces dermatitidis ER-3]|uniref:WSC domain-containing protein n=1 Tax=Ajellomyces dermatitidis (strain ER-3 / ATCC MYA-2586) TaxID=559297 RepID=A0ABP2EY23_AJEDR|nr:hypothetical protein, variant 1 [Blastomyces dermatitidis ER-3]XP_045280801.1 uncharacterized protein BDCG_04220 [Blastomyces dermatitidis ER-3]XP_045280802.1 hypothetical protein, variant 2 [Blastomyces dermatitidis ER-3]XP_045280803.1 hypothetical protein, variant 3 [Blastomyces dermatitidis ER-3]EEQ89100.1 hypothetical protein, variant 1 [Blastomyces dermatitidis ER-3]OAT01074.1 hypothetical protein BDCG_04220 [Blastomyces dermatitidis ER-3]OAT01075.1 hypothetical protein, variant 2 [Bl